jgi:hypothetical protein
MADFPMFLADLPEANRQHIRHCIRILLRWFAMCDGRLRSYEADDAKAGHQSVIKLLQTLKETRVMIEEMENELIEKHRVPDNSKQVDDEFRQDSKNLLTLGRTTQG